MDPLFSRVPIFAGLNAPALELLYAKVVKHRYKRGEVVLKEGEPGNRFFLI